MSAPITEETAKRLADAIERLCELMEDQLPVELPREEPRGYVAPLYARRPKEGRS